MFVPVVLNPESSFLWQRSLIICEQSSCISSDICTGFRGSDGFDLQGASLPCHSRLLDSRLSTGTPFRWEYWPGKGSCLRAADYGVVRSVSPGDGSILLNMHSLRSLLFLVIFLITFDIYVVQCTTHHTRNVHVMNTIHSTFNTYNMWILVLYPATLIILLLLFIAFWWSL